MWYRVWRTFRRGDEFNSYVVEKTLRSNPAGLPLFNRHKVQELKDLDTDPPVLLLGLMTAAGVIGHLLSFSVKPSSLWQY